MMNRRPAGDVEVRVANGRLSKRFDEIQAKRSALA